MERTYGRNERGRHLRRLAAFGLIAGLTLAGCGSGNGSGSSEPSPSASPSASRPGPRPSSTAELSIVSPENGEVVRGSTIDLRVALEGATIVPQTTTDIRPNEGHLHVSLDGNLISMTEGLEQAIAEVAPGLHLLTIEFVASDHAPFDPRVVAVASFEVRP